MKKLIIGGLIIVVGICAGSFKVATNIMDGNAAKSKSPTVNVDKPQIAEANATSVLTKSVTDTVESEKAATRIEIVTTMHEMANTLILAEDNKIWGRVTVTKETVSELLNILNNSKPFEEKDTFIATVKKWQNGDFANIVNDHNMVWKILKGTVGKANEPNIQAVAQAKETLK